MARHVGYGTLVVESIGAARRLKPMWLLGIFVLYLQAGYVVVIQRNAFSLFDDVLSGAAVFALLPGLAVILCVLHAAADAALITAGAEVATGGAPELAESWHAGRRKTGPMLVTWLLLGIVLAAWAGVTAGVPILLGVFVHPLIGVGFGLLGLVLFFITFLFLLPLGMYAARALVLHDDDLSRAWRSGLVMVRAHPARAAGITLTATAYTLSLWCIELLVVLIAMGVGAFVGDTLPVPVLVAVVVLVLLPAYAGVRGWFGSALSYFWTMAFLWTARDAALENEET